QLAIPVVASAPPGAARFPYTTLFRSVELGEEVGDVPADGAGAHGEGGGDLAVALAVGQEAEDVALARGEAGFGGKSDREIAAALDRKSTRLNSSHSQISYAVFCLKKK